MNDVNINAVVKGHRTFLSGVIEPPSTYYFYGPKMHKLYETELLKILLQRLLNLCRV